MPSASKPPVATIEEALARPESERVELIRGTLVQKPGPTGEHSRTQAHVVSGIITLFVRRTDLAYALVLTAKAGQSIRAEPFEAVELRTEDLFGNETDDR